MLSRQSKCNKCKNDSHKKANITPLARNRSSITSRLYLPAKKSIRRHKQRQCRRARKITQKKTFEPHIQRQHAGIHHFGADFGKKLLLTSTNLELILAPSTQEVTGLNKIFKIGLYDVTQKTKTLLRNYTTSLKSF